MKVLNKKVEAEEKPKLETSEAETRETTPPAGEAPEAAEDVKMEEPSSPEVKKETTSEEPKRKRKQRKPKKVELDEEGNPIAKKKRKLNHQCAAVKICHALMQSYRSKLSEEDQGHLAKFCQLNRGDQGVMFNNMCVSMRGHLKERYPGLEKWEDMDFDEEGKRDGYANVVNSLLDDYMKVKREEPKPKADEAAEAKAEA